MLRTCDPLHVFVGVDGGGGGDDDRDGGEGYCYSFDS